MKAIQGKGKKKCDPQRRGLLAKIHIAYQQQNLTDEDYWGILEREFGEHSRKGLTSKEIAKGKRTAKYLSILELQYLVDYFVQHGWKARVRGQQVEKLRERATDIAGEIANGERRLKGLAKKILGVDRLEWCRDPARLKRLLAVLEKIKKTQSEWD